MFKKRKMEARKNGMKTAKLEKEKNGSCKIKF